MSQAYWPERIMLEALRWLAEVCPEMKAVEAGPWATTAYAATWLAVNGAPEGGIDVHGLAMQDSPDSELQAAYESGETERILFLQRSAVATELNEFRRRIRRHYPSEDGATIGEVAAEIPPTIAIPDDIAFVRNGTEGWAVREGFHFQIARWIDQIPIGLHE